MESFSKAAEYGTRALALAESAGWREGQAAAHTSLGSTAARSGDLGAGVCVTSREPEHCVTGPAGFPVSRRP